MFDDVAGDIREIALEAEAIRRVPQREDVPGRMGLVLELAAETSIDRVQRRLTQFWRDMEVLRLGGDV